MLPPGYRWATESECEYLLLSGELEGYIMVPLRFDARGIPYTHGEADIAVPMEA